MTRAEEKSIAYQLATHGPKIIGGSAILSDEEYNRWNINYDFLNGYEQAEKDLGWISVKDKLPGPSEWVVACIEQHGHAQCLTLATYNEETKVWHTDEWEDGEQEIYNPDYWMPIPNRIKEERK